MELFLSRLFKCYQTEWIKFSSWGLGIYQSKYFWMCRCRHVFFFFFTINCQHYWTNVSNILEEKTRSRRGEMESTVGSDNPGWSNTMQMRSCDCFPPIHLCHPPLRRLYCSELHYTAVLCLHRGDTSHNWTSVTLGSRQLLNVNIFPKWLWNPCCNSSVRYSISAAGWVQQLKLRWFPRTSALIA